MQFQKNPEVFYTLVPVPFEHGLKHLGNTNFKNSLKELSLHASDPDSISGTPYGPSGVIPEPGVRSKTEHSQM